MVCIVTTLGSLFLIPRYRSNHRVAISTLDLNDNNINDYDYPYYVAHNDSKHDNHNDYVDDKYDNYNNDNNNDYQLP